MSAGRQGSNAPTTSLTVRASSDGLLVGFRVSPAAKATRLQGAYGDRLKAQVSAPPEDGRANEELRRALARWLDLPTDYVIVYAGHKKRDKVLAIRGLGEAELRKRLRELAQAAGR